MTATRINPAMKVTKHSASGVTINGGANYYASLGSLAAVPGYVPVAARFDMSGMSGFDRLVTGALQDNGTYLWARIHNSQSSACTGRWSAKVYWLPG